MGTGHDKRPAAETAEVYDVLRTANTDVLTGIAYGYISANALEPEVVDDLLYRYNEVCTGDEDGSEGDLPEAEGVTPEGVRYCTSHLGGALNFFILWSPIVTDRARRASPCVPNAGIIDTLDGSVTSYDVPAEWRWTEPAN